ncbi:NF038120 family PEP-CTERM protein [Duganella callida]|uniref:NF038120 family PEP-CTERM protein n=1 Tax=Duganella callida TaxID=2561932 RepID=UPI00142F4BCF|nr:NF038120 family PEP-CTERM protein [Duganella callida]
MKRASVWLARAGAALGFSMGMMMAAPAHAEVTAIEQMQGWITNFGMPNRPGPDSNNYTGNETGRRFNSWASFYIPAGQYASATLSLTPSFYGDAPPSVIGLFDVDTPYSTMQEDVFLGAGVYKDLGSGRQYGSATLYDSPVTITLNGRALADINAKAGGYFLIGFTNQTMNALPLTAPDGGIYISGFGRNQNLMELHLAAVPEPSTWAAMLAGLSLLLWRSRQLRRRSALAATAALAALALAPAAQADTIDFEHLSNVGWLNGGDGFSAGGYAFQAEYVPIDDQDTGNGLVGALLDGGYAGLCTDGGLTCPTNASGHYYGGLNDGQLNMTAASGHGPVKLAAFDASFIGGQQLVYPDVAGVLQLRGIRANGTSFEEAYTLGAPVNGFAHYETSAAFRAEDFVQISFFAYSCDFEQNCVAFGSSAGQFGLDNLQIAAVPEPSTYLMLSLGLGLITLAGVRRRAV